MSLHKFKIETVIVMVNYNGYSDTQTCLQSINKLSKPPLVVLVDNASKGAKNLESLHSTYSPLHIIYNKENVGFGKANNIGIQWAQDNIQFNYICLLNNDTLVTPEFLKHLKQPFAIDPKIGITTGKIFYESNRDIIWYGGGEINYTRGWPKIDDYNKAPSAEGANTSKYVSFISGCLMLFTKDSIAKLKGFDEDFFMYCEDLELCLRAKVEGIKMFYTADSVIYHKVQGSLKQTEAKKTGMNPKNPNLKFLFYNMKMNQYLSCKKHFKGLSLLRFILIFKSQITYKYLIFLKNKRFDLTSSYLKLFFVKW